MFRLINNRFISNSKSNQFLLSKYYCSNYFCTTTSINFTSNLNNNIHNNNSTSNNNSNNSNIINDINRIQNETTQQLKQQNFNNINKQKKNNEESFEDEEIKLEEDEHDDEDEYCLVHSNMNNGIPIKKLNRFRFNYLGVKFQIDAMSNCSVSDFIKLISSSTLFSKNMVLRLRKKEMLKTMSRQDYIALIRREKSFLKSPYIQSSNSISPFNYNLEFNGEQCDQNSLLNSFFNNINTTTTTTNTKDQINSSEIIFELTHSKESLSNNSSYANNITYQKAFEELKSLAKMKDLQNEFKLSDQLLDEYIQSFENELAICHPQILRDLQLDKKTKHRLVNSMIEHFDYQKSLELKKKKKMASPNDLVEEMADLKYPHRWFPEARAIKRKFVLHVGPTNSGKTHNALEALKSADSGVYCGPLRLLAQEIYDRLNAVDVKCNLLTGQQNLVVRDARHLACTIEMASTNRLVDVAVIDEFQMIADLGRGWAWTRAVLGLPAREIHLCGDNTAVSLIEKLAKTTGDTIEVRYYERLAPLRVESKSVDWRRTLEKGDCIISFSRRDILETKSLIERRGLKCAVVYGALPPETRANQAQLFNEPDSGYDVLVASDAIGMGLNLNIRRVIFSEIKKFDGKEMRKLVHSEVKQIAGRAGRFRSEFPEGLVTSVSSINIGYIKEQLELPNVVTERAGIFPQEAQLEQFARHLGKEVRTFSELLERFFECTNLDNLYFMENTDDKIKVARLIDHIKLPVKTKYAFIMAPLKLKEKESNIEKIYVKYTALFGRGVEVPHMVEEPICVSQDYNDLQNYLGRLEECYAILDLYLWLAQRFQVQFSQFDTAYQLSIQVNQNITDTLIKLSNLKISRREEKQKLRNQDNANGSNIHNRKRVFRQYIN
ncbi:Mitochondrial RNA helicase [Heterostelium album PN500]|uniref:RNA helicase n=1 Tax=Heterostelium pallidum (strain ATCC 26659 / Pp 5 / PN500) TaxID=670386 RepID=D3BKM5_HETP5|nr:Mitochondrial RNA helicase [Heterostelium album PN500]EFA78455.1 Mitochondrial RNA helicase [Heterostelium album PN500]|eukprot:XP_020430579.1 Mitochondrial RNA helicase [Heterostelium album PN500]